MLESLCGQVIEDGMVDMGRRTQVLDGALKDFVPLDIFNMCIFHFGLSGHDCTKDEQKQPKKSAAFGGRLLVLC